LNINPYESPQSANDPKALIADVIFDLRFTLSAAQIERSISTYQATYYQSGCLVVTIFFLLMISAVFLGFTSILVVFGIPGIISIGLPILFLRMEQQRMQRTMASKFGIRPTASVRLRIDSTTLSISTVQTTAEFPLRQAALLKSPRDYLILTPMQGVVLPIPMNATCDDGQLGDVIDLVRARLGAAIR